MTNTMTRTLRSLWATLLCLALQTPALADEDLHRQLGEKAGLQSIVEDLWQQVNADTRLAPFFKKTDHDNFVASLTEQLCAVSGGPCRYTGGKMGPVHEEMNIGRADFNALVEVLQQAMSRHGVPFSAQNQLLAKLAPMHRQIVTR